MLFLSIALFLALKVTTSFIIHELYENSKGTSSPSLGSVIGTIVGLIFFKHCCWIRLMKEFRHVDC